MSVIFYGENEKNYIWMLKETQINEESQERKQINGSMTGCS